MNVPLVLLDEFGIKPGRFVRCFDANFQLVRGRNYLPQTDTDVMDASETIRSSSV